MRSNPDRAVPTDSGSRTERRVPRARFARGASAPASVDRINPRRGPAATATAASRAGAATPTARGAPTRRAPAQTI
jgi:hypothetical protein